MGRKHVPRSTIEQARKLAAKTGNLSEVAKEIGVHRSTVARWAEDWDAALDRPETPKRRQHPKKRSTQAANAGESAVPAPSNGQSADSAGDAAPNGSETPSASVSRVSTLQVDQTPLPSIGSDTGDDEPHHCGNCKIILDHVSQPTYCHGCGRKLRWDRVK